VLSLDPYVLRFNNGTPGEIYGNSGTFCLLSAATSCTQKDVSARFNYDASVAFDHSTYPNTRFVNEFGFVIIFCREVNTLNHTPSSFHSMPSFYTWKEVLTSPADFSFNSTVVMSRDHHPPASDLTFPNPHAPQGQAEMTSAVERWLPTPFTKDSNQTFTQWCWSTQVFQAMTVVSQAAWYRRGAGKAENNMGALVWQLNDIWQGVSWSSIEYSGRWKVLQYGLTGVFSPLVIYPFWTAGKETLQVFVISDRWEEVLGSAQLTWYDWSGALLSTHTYDFTVPGLDSVLLYDAKGLNSILPVGRKARDVWLILNLTAEVDNQTMTNEQYVSGHVHMTFMS
jgi:beta-mannosidase